jgi:hypothetical protein
MYCQKKYTKILKGLCGQGEPDEEDLATKWQAPLCPSRDLHRAVQHFRTSFSQIGFVPSVTWLTVDDDLLRLRSRRVGEAGFCQINNPAKGMGIVHHGAVSVVTRLYLAGHVQQRGQSTSDCVTMIQQALTNASCDNLIEFDGELIFSDRGYGGPDGGINRMTLKRKGLIAGTSKRSPSFPFTYGAQQPGPDRRLIAEDGAAGLWYAEKFISIGRGRVRQAAMAYRNGLGRVVLMHSSSDVC